MSKIKDLFQILHSPPSFCLHLFNSDLMHILDNIVVLKGNKAGKCIIKISSNKYEESNWVLMQLWDQFGPEFVSVGRKQFKSINETF